MEFDEALKKIGQCSLYQRILFTVLGVAKIETAFLTMGIVFIAGVPDHWCQSSELNHLNLTDQVLRNLTLPLVQQDGQSASSTCTRYSYNYSAWTKEDVYNKLTDGASNVSTESCPDGWTYDTTEYTSTIVSQWNLVCDDSWLRAVSSSVYMAGFMVGVFSTGIISDIFGRRPTLIASYVCGWTVAFLTAFSPNYIVFCVLRFFTALFHIGCSTCAFVLITEVTGPDYRSIVGIGTLLFWSAGMMIYAGIAYFLRDWFTQSIVAISVFFPLCIIAFFLPESPRWLYTKGQNEKAEVLLRKMAKINGTSSNLPQHLYIRVGLETKVEKGYFWDLWRTKHMGLRSANLCFIWFVISIVYYGLALNTSNLGGNDFINFFISGAVEIPAYILSIVATRRIGRRWQLCISLLLAGVPLLCITAVPIEHNLVTVILAMMGKFWINAAFGIIYLFTAELYPTVVRNLGIGTASVFARIGGIVAPVINELNNYSRLIPLITFGSLSLAAGLLSLALPETKDRDLPETLQDGENFGRTEISKNVEVEKDELDDLNPQKNREELSRTADEKLMTKVA